MTMIINPFLINIYNETIIPYDLNLIIILLLVIS